MKKSLFRNNGFTIIEMLLATAILAFVVAGMTVALQQQQRQAKFTGETVDVDQTARTLLDFISTEIRNAGARQGKNISIQLVNGGSIADEATRCTVDAADSLTGTKDSPPDCITLTTWDIARGITNDPTNPANNTLNKKPSKVEQPEPPRLVAGSIVLDLPESWFDQGEFIGGTIGETNKALIGFRSKSNLCHPNEEINCLENLERCTQCAMIFEADIDSALEQATITSIDDIIEENLPVTFNTLDDIINGVDFDTADADPTLYGLIHSITLQPSDLSIVKTKTLRLNPENREIQLSEDGEEFVTIAGGESGDLGALEVPGIVDLQFVFHLQDPDGRTSRVGICNNGDCNNQIDRIFDDFSEDIVIIDDYYGAGGGDTDDLRCCAGREQDIRAIEIFLVVKSKGKPRKLSGNFFKQNIRPFADVGQRIAPNPDGSDDTLQSDLKEPENGFVYRIFSTTVYMRNLSTENYG